MSERMAAWNSDDSYDDRVAALDAMFTVVDDDEEDRLTGGGGRDLFFAGLGDIFPDLKNDEVVL